MEPGKKAKVEENKLDSKSCENEIKNLLADIQKRDPEQPEFLQAVSEVAWSLKPLFVKKPEYLRVFRVLVEPERIVQFRVSWTNDQGKLQVNRGWRVQFNSAIGPYKGGLRFHPTVNLSILKFLGFEQIFKNSLTSLALGGAKGGSDFDPHGKSEAEVLRFCQSFMTELFRHIGPDTDVPAGDIGVGSREIGFLFGQYKRIVNRFEGVLTGKGQTYGGSLMRPEATGYGICYIAKHLLADQKMELKGMKCLVSGAGNVAQFCAQKLIEEGAILLTMSDSSGYIYEPKGITKEQLDHIFTIKNEKRGRIKDYLKFSETAKYKADAKVWEIPADIAFPCATQNEIDVEDAKVLIKNGIKAIVEGANMPSTNQALELFTSNKIRFIPAKAANAGGVAVSGLEMSQNSVRLSWRREEVNAKLEMIMGGIYGQLKDAAGRLGNAEDLQLGANAAGFMKVADAMLAQGDVCYE